MEDKTDKIDETSNESATEAPDVSVSEANVELEQLTDKWKRALADAENARKRADMAQLDGRKHGVAMAVEALAPAYDDICMAIEAAKASPESDNPLIAAHLEGLQSAKSAFDAGLTALGVKTIAPENTPFDPVLHEAMQMQETDETKPGVVLVLHRLGFALGKRLIRPAHVTVSARPSTASDRQQSS